MRETRIFIEQPLAPGAVVLLEAESSRHLSRVLRLKAGAALRLFNGDGREFSALLLDPGKSQAAQVEVVELSHREAETALGLHLLLGISKGERMDFALQKAVELGVTRISPLLTRRGTVRLKGDRLEKRHLHWHKVVVSACEQSGRCRLPGLDRPQKPDTLPSPGADWLRLVLYPQGAQTLHQLTVPRRGVQLLIGPEGGLAVEELDWACGEGFIPLKLGPRVLRTETAPLAALAAIQTLWGDFRSV